MMATVTFRKCDVTGSKTNIGRYVVNVWQLEDGESDPVPVRHDIVCEVKDLSPKIVARLQAAIERVLTKPGTVKGKVLVEDKQIANRAIVPPGAVAAR